MQASLADYADQRGLWDFDHYGPTRRRPVPEAEAKRTVLREKIRQYGFNLDCIREADGVIPGQHTEFHPDDERELWECGGRQSVFGDSRLSEINELIREDLAEVAP